MADDGIKLTREELYQKVWSKPATRLAKEFGISDVALAILTFSLLGAGGEGDSKTGVGVSPPWVRIPPSPFIPTFSASPLWSITANSNRGATLSHLEATLASGGVE